MTFSTDGSRLVSVSRSGTWLWDVKSGRAVRGENTGNETQANASLYCLFPDGKIVVLKDCVGDGDASVRMWKTGSGLEIKTPIQMDRTSTTPLVFSPDSRYLVSRSSNMDSDADSTSNALQIWHAVTGEVIGDSFPIPGSVHCIILSPDGRRMICGGEYK